MGRMQRFDLRDRVRSFRHALRGIRLTHSTQHNAWIHAVATLAAVGAGFWFGIGRGEWLAVVLAIVAVWSAAALCNVASPELHPQVARAKDVAAGAVLIGAIGAVVIGLLVLGPRLLGSRY